MADADDRVEAVARYSKWRLPMFGHRHVSVGRHSAGVFGATLFTSFALALFTVGLTTWQLQPWTRPEGGSGFGAIVTLGSAIWLGSAIPILIGGGFFFTAAYIVLRLARRNFGLAYPATGFLAGIVIIQINGTFRGYVTPGELITSAALGLLAGGSYWLIAYVFSEPTTRPHEEERECGEQLQLDY